MSLYLKVAESTLYQLIARSLTTFSNFIIILLIAKSLGSFGLGQYNKVFAFVGIFSLFVDFGMSAIFLKLGKDRDLPLLIISRLIIALIIFVTIQPILFSLPYNQTLHAGFSWQEKIYVEIVALVLFLYAFTHSFNVIFQKKQRFDLTIWPSAVYGLIVIIIASYSFFNKNLTWFFLATIIGLLANLSLSLFLIYKKLHLAKPNLHYVSTNLPFITTLFKKSLFLGATLFLNILYVRVDVLILSFLRSTTEVGIYTLAYKFFEFPLNFSTFIMSALYPIFLKTYQKNKDKFSKQVKKSALFIFIFSFFIFIFSLVAAPAISLIKHEFYQSILPFRILSFSYPIFFLSNLFLWVIITKNKERILPLVYGCSLILNIVLNLIFIPQYGYNASAVITVVSELFVLAFFILLLKNLKK